MLGPKVVKHEPSRGTAAPTVPVLPFENLDADQDGSIQPIEYYQVAKEVNTRDPVYGLLWILGAVVFCTLSSSLLLRPKKGVLKSNG